MNLLQQACVTLWALASLLRPHPHKPYPPAPGYVCWTSPYTGHKLCDWSPDVDKALALYQRRWAGEYWIERRPRELGGLKTR